MKNKTKISRKINPKIILIGVIALVLALIQLFISQRLATAGEEVRQFESKAAQIGEENRILVEEIGKMGSLSMISFKAREIGLVKTTQVFHLTPQIPVALK